MALTTKKSRFKRVCVIGSGVMGSGIAAQLANAHVPCLLLDVTPADVGLKKALSAKPAAFFTPKNASLIEVGDLNVDIDKIKSCDWVIEVVVEDLKIKQNLFEKLEGIINSSTIVSSNTSGLSIHEILKGRSESFQERFLVTHFFNPPRYLHLLELVVGTKTREDVLQRVAWFGEEVLGKGIVYGKDTPNFVANRIGVFAMMEIMRLMRDGDYSIEEVDAIFGPSMGRPKSAVFRTADVVGLDTFLHVARNNTDVVIPEFLERMVKNGSLGQKSGQGFYRKHEGELQALNLKTFEYEAKKKVRFESLGAIRNMENLDEKIRFLTSADDRAGKLAFQALASTCIYAANRLFEIADDIVQIDNAIKWGFGWDKGIFETWDAMGVQESVTRMAKEGMTVPAWVAEMLAKGRNTFYQQETYWDPATKSAKQVPSDDKTLSLTILKQQSTNMVKDGFAASLIDMGDGVLACEFHTKMNAIDGDVLQGIHDGLDLCEAGQFNALVLTNEGVNFSVGANIFLLYMAAMQGEWEQINQMIKRFQDTSVRLRYSAIPTVAAPFQMTLGGGTELSMWCNRICANAELYMGLVEVGVGLIPGGGGNISMLARTLNGAVDEATFPTEALIRRAFETVAMAKVSTSAEEAKKLMYLSCSDPIVMNKRHLVNSAKQMALGMARAGFIPPLRREFRLPGKSARATFEMVLTSMRDGHQISEHDFKIAGKVADVMTGGDCTPRVPVKEQYLLDLEREAFLSLCGEEKTLARISYMLENNKPLRN